MKKIILSGFYLIFIGFLPPVCGQSRITGKLVDTEQGPIVSAHVLLFQDSVFLQGTLSENNGVFELLHHSTLPVRVQIQSLGYSSFRIDELSVQPLVDLGTITLEASQGELSEVIISGNRPLFEQRIDRTIINVQSSITSLGNSVLGVLGKSPAVRVNRGANEINLMGKQGVVVMVDGKPLRLEAADLVNFLDNLSTDNILSIELIHSPPASFDAQGNAGIINIVTSKFDRATAGKISGNVGYGQRPKYGMNLSLGGG